MKYSYKKHEKGITLIALIITIIILLILAGVSMSVVFGDNGILNKSIEAKEKTDIEEEKEGIGFAVTTSRIGDSEYEELDKDNLQNAIDNKGRIIL